MLRLAAKADKNQRVIVEALRRVGATVVLLHTVGHGCPDLLVGFRGETFLLEVKSAKGRLTPAQKDLHSVWVGRPIKVVRTIADAFCAIGLSAVGDDMGKRWG